jgi:RNA 2',3'-cyclic 3'-phosphodiesterase
MSEIGRGFLAVVPPARVLDAIEAGVAPLRPTQRGIRWAPREQWHLTVQFLGRVADVDQLVAGLRAALEPVPAFALRLGGAGAFPSPQRASVAWIGVRDGRESLMAVADAVHAGTELLGFARDERVFRPHVTVGRLAKPAPALSIVDGLADLAVGPAWSVEELVLFESRTRPSGAEHHERARITLAPRDRGVPESDH